MILIEIKVQIVIFKSIYSMIYIVCHELWFNLIAYIFLICRANCTRTESNGFHK